MSNIEGYDTFLTKLGEIICCPICKGMHPEGHNDTELNTRLRRVVKWYDERISEFGYEDPPPDFIILRADTLDELAGIILKPTRIKSVEVKE